MMKSFKDLNCFSKMINSIMSMTQKSSHNENQNKNDSKKKKSRRFKKSDLGPTSNTNSCKVQQEQQNNDQKIKQTANFASIKNSQTKGDQNSKNQQLYPQLCPQNIQQVEPQTQRSLINKTINQLSEPSESDQNDLPTQKSDIIMNYIGKSVNHNQNIFMNQSKEDLTERFENIYEKIKFMRSERFYQVYQVKKKSTDAFFYAFVTRDFEVFQKKWKLSESESIEKYTELYERQKIHIRNLTELQKQNCRHSAKLIDYELRPPTYDMTSSERKFSKGSIAIVFENVQQSLQEFLANNSLDKSQKKKLVYQLVTCLGDVHNCKMGVRDLSLKNFYIDRFQNVKFMSLEVEQFGCYSKSIFEKGSQPEQNQVQERLLYLPPYDNNQSTEEQDNLWKLGVVIGKILTGKFIFNQSTPEAQKQQIIKVLSIEQGQFISSEFKQKLQGLSQGQIQIIGSLLKLDHNDRKSCKELLECRYLQNLLQQDQ